MQKDMHYYGTYAIARMAGLKLQDVKIIAYSALFVDDSTETDSQTHTDRGLLYGVATAHHPKQASLQYIRHQIKQHYKRANIGNLQQRRIWIPFHFYPGNEGKNLSEKLICRKNSRIVNEMFDNHIKHTAGFIYILHLIGIASHIYMDTFSHYGFSGLSSEVNTVNPDSIKVNNEERLSHKEILSKFIKKYKKEYHSMNLLSILPNIINLLSNSFKSKVATIGSGSLGHGPVATFPDLPYLK